MPIYLNCANANLPKRESNILTSLVYMIRVAFSQQPHQHKQVDVEQAEEGDEHGHGGGGAGVDDRLAGGDKTAVCKNCKTGFSDRRH